MENIESGKNESFVGPKFPVKSNLNLVYISTLILVVLMTGVSLTGILYRGKVYTSKEVEVIFVSNDILNIALGAPILIISMLLTIRKKLFGLLCYPGALFFITYVYATYLLSLPLNILFIPYLILTALSIYTIIALVINIESEPIKHRLRGQVPIKSAGAIVFIIGILIVIYQIYQIVTSLINHLEADQMMMAQWIADLLIASPPVLIVGYLMMRGNAIGYSLGNSLLLLLSVLFIGLIPILIVKGILTSSPIDVPDIIIILGSSMICFIPFLLFRKGIIKSSKVN
jgi:hypothetical protein